MAAELRFDVYLQKCSKVSMPTHLKIKPSLSLRIFF